MIVDESFAADEVDDEEEDSKEAAAANRASFLFFFLSLFFPSNELALDAEDAEEDEEVPFPSLSFLVPPTEDERDSCSSSSSEASWVLVGRLREEK